jgi:hypothetical protein
MIRLHVVRAFGAISIRRLLSLSLSHGRREELLRWRWRPAWSSGGYASLPPSLSPVLPTSARAPPAQPPPPHRPVTAGSRVAGAWRRRVFRRRPAGSSSDPVRRGGAEGGSVAAGSTEARASRTRWTGQVGANRGVGQDALAGGGAWDADRPRGSSSSMLRRLAPGGGDFWQRHAFSLLCGGRLPGGALPPLYACPSLFRPCPRREGAVGAGGLGVGVMTYSA